MYSNELLARPTLGPRPNLRDKEHEKFVEEFEQTLVAINRFAEATNQHIPFLMRKAEARKNTCNKDEATQSWPISRVWIPSM